MKGAVVPTADQLVLQDLYNKYRDLDSAHYKAGVAYRTAAQIVNKRLINTTQYSFSDDFAVVTESLNAETRPRSLHSVRSHNGSKIETGICYASIRWTLPL